MFCIIEDRPNGIPANHWHTKSELKAARLEAARYVKVSDNGCQAPVLRKQGDEIRPLSFVAF